MVKAIAVILLTIAASAQPKSPYAQAVARINIAATQPTDWPEAVQSINILFDEDGPITAKHLRDEWLTPLMNGRHFAEVDQLATRGILAVPADLVSLEAFEVARIRALLASDRPANALSEAKALYNICSMAHTGQAMLLITECLNAAHPDDPTIAQRFRDQQIAGAVFDGQLVVVQSPIDSGAIPTTRPAPKSVTDKTGPPILPSIKLDAHAYDSAFARLTAEDFPTLCAKGNLLLLEDRIDDARGVFERAYSLAPDAGIVAASENIARCMKAQDAAVGRANAWLISIRPKPKHE